MDRQNYQNIDAIVFNKTYLVEFIFPSLIKFWNSQFFSFLSKQGPRGSHKLSSLKSLQIQKTKRDMSKEVSLRLRHLSNH